MTIPTMLLLFGGVLLLIAILGGGFEIRELKVQKVATLSRVTAAAVGIIFVFMGVNFEESSSENISVPSSIPSDSMVTFTIHDHLSEKQASAQTVVLIDGKRVGTLTVNEFYPDAMIAVTVRSRGRYSYTLDSRIIFKEGQKLVEYSGTGQGTINVEANKKFENKYSASGSTILLVLEESE